MLYVIPVSGDNVNIKRYPIGKHNRRQFNLKRCIQHEITKKTKAILYYIIPNNVNKDDTLTIGTCFELYDGPCFIGTGTVIEYWEER